MPKIVIELDIPDTPLGEAAAEVLRTQPRIITQLRTLAELRSYIGISGRGLDGFIRDFVSLRSGAPFTPVLYLNGWRVVEVLDQEQGIDTTPIMVGGESEHAQVHYAGDACLSIIQTDEEWAEHVRGVQERSTLE